MQLLWPKNRAVNNGTAGFAMRPFLAVKTYSRGAGTWIMKALIERQGSLLWIKSRKQYPALAVACDHQAVALAVCR